MGVSNEAVLPEMKFWNMTKPDALAWGSSTSTEMDETWSKNELLGLDANQALSKLIGTGSSYAEWLEFAPKEPFQFYLSVMLKYLLSDDSKDNFGVSSSLFDMLPRKIEKCPECFDGIRDFLPSILVEIAGKQEFYDADADLFGDFQAKASSIIDSISL